jgi:hypothetical protein
MHPPLPPPHLGGLRGGEEHGLSVLGQQRHNLAHLLLKPNLQDAVRLVNHLRSGEGQSEAAAALAVGQRGQGRAQARDSRRARAREEERWFRDASSLCLP